MARKTKKRNGRRSNGRRRGQRKTYDFKGINECYLQGALVNPEFREGKNTDFFIASLEIPPTDGEKYPTYVNIKAFDEDILSILEEYEEGDVLHCMGRFNVYKAGKTYYYSFIVEEIYDPEEDEEDE